LLVVLLLVGAAVVGVVGVGQAMFMPWPCHGIGVVGV
jgi:hypothetical protein